MIPMASPASSSGSDDLQEAVSRLLDAVSDGSLRVSVSLVDSAEMTALKDEIAALQAALQVERDSRARADLLAAQSTTQFIELLDLCRAYGVPLPERYSSGRRRRRS